MSEPNPSPPQPHRVQWHWLALLFVVLLGAGGIMYRQHQQSQVAACTVNMLETKAALVQFKQTNGRYPTTWDELSTFKGTVQGVCWQSSTRYTLEPIPDGGVALRCPVHHTLDTAPP